MRSSLICLLLAVPFAGQAQFELRFDPTVPVVRDGAPLGLAWGGGLNYPQFSNIDLNADGTPDLLLFDRSGGKAISLLHTGTPGAESYTLTHEYDNVLPFPFLRDWTLMRDYNCDGKEDIFTCTSPIGTAGFAVYKNTSVGSNLSFELVKEVVGGLYPPMSPNLYVASIDIPGIIDVDGDGDLDVLTFSVEGSHVDYMKNMSMELYGTCDSLTFERRNNCWGFFYENSNNNSVTLNFPCDWNQPNPEMPLSPDEVEELADLLRSDPSRAGEVQERLSAAHFGSTLTPIDLDGNGVIDLVLGDVAYPNLVALMNGGEVDSAMMVSQDIQFPSYDVPANLTVFPAAFHVDVNNDGRRDLMVAPSYQGLSQNKVSVWYYRNTSATAGVVLQKVDEDLFQGDMIDLGEGAWPVLFDHNGDGLMDLIVANYGYYSPNSAYPCKFALLENTGTAQQPAFTQVTDDYMGLSTSGIGNAMYPAFGDVDGDGDLDLYIGDLQGLIHFYRNISTGPVASFQLAQAAVQNDLGQNIDVGQSATPLLHDLDDDGLLDLIVGERNGNLNHYRNIGSSSAPTWQFVTDSLGKVDTREYWNVTGFSTPFIYRNEAGDRQLLCGSESGWIHHYNDIEEHLDGAWNLVDSMWMDIREGGRTAVVVHDFNGDADPDAVVGNYRGGLSFFRNDFSVGIGSQDPSDWPAENVFTLAPNPSASSTDLVIGIPLVRDVQLSLCDGTGRILRTLPVRSKRLTLSTTDLPNGVYLLRLADEGRSWTQRLVVLH
ncbi:MAG TPA: T9SS type A sorting domain-containing protein [Flavobacteriales bacterium]